MAILTTTELRTRALEQAKYVTKRMGSRLDTAWLARTITTLARLETGARSDYQYGDRIGILGLSREQQKDASWRLLKTYWTYPIGTYNLDVDKNLRWGIARLVHAVYLKCADGTLCRDITAQQSASVSCGSGMLYDPGSRKCVAADTAMTRTWAHIVQWRFDRYGEGGDYTDYVKAYRKADAAIWTTKAPAAPPAGPAPAKSSRSSGSKPSGSSSSGGSGGSGSSGESASAPPPGTDPSAYRYEGANEAALTETLLAAGIAGGVIYGIHYLTSRKPKRRGGRRRRR